MRVLAIETSCDETAAAVIEREGDTITELSNVIASSAPIHALTGGIIPEKAAREQVRLIIPTIVAALEEAQLLKNDSVESIHTAIKNSVDAIAVTYGPGLIGSLLIGVETAKTLAFTLNKPLVPVNHLLGHIFANFIREDIGEISFPLVALIVSGGHTDLLVFRSYTEYTWLGGTRDDAAGEAYDKIGRLLNLPYPAGPVMEKRAEMVDPKKQRMFKFTSPMLRDNSYDFSFSGLKTEVHRLVQGQQSFSDEEINEICFATQKAIIDVLVEKTLRAAGEYNVSTILLGGGVSANNALRKEIELNAKRYQLDANVYFPPLKFCTDNAAMIGAYALLDYQPHDWRTIKSNPELYFA